MEAKHFGNVVAYSKGWYKKRDQKWMDMIHVINADGYSLRTKQDVAAWCLHRLDDYREMPDFPYPNQLSISYIFGEVNKHIERSKLYYGRQIDQLEAIIEVYLNIVMELNVNWFTSGVKPSNDILPLYLHTPYCLKHEQKYIFAELLCEAQERVNKIFPDYEEQKIEFWNDYIYQETIISNKSFKDVVIPVGYDNLNDCIETILTGREINNGHGMFKYDVIDPVMYANCNDIENEKMYKVRLYPKKTMFDVIYEIHHISH